MTLTCGSRSLFTCFQALGRSYLISPDQCQKQLFSLVLPKRRPRWRNRGATPKLYLRRVSSSNSEPWLGAVAGLQRSFVNFTSAWAVFDQATHACAKRPRASFCYRGLLHFVKPGIWDAPRTTDESLKSHTMQARRFMSKVYGNTQTLDVAKNARSLQTICLRCLTDHSFLVRF